MQKQMNVQPEQNVFATRQASPKMSIKQKKIAKRAIKSKVRQIARKHFSKSPKAAQNAKPLSLFSALFGSARS